MGLCESWCCLWDSRSCSCFYDKPEEKGTKNPDHDLKKVDFGWTGDESEDELQAEPGDADTLDDEEGIAGRRVIVFDDLSLVVRGQVDFVMLELRQCFDAEDHDGGDDDEDGDDGHVTSSQRGSRILKQ